MMEWLKAWQFWLAIVSAAFTAITWAMGRTYASRDAHLELSGRVDELETTVETLPTTKTVHALELQLREVSTLVQGQRDLITRVERKVDLLLENELKGK
ncbi:MAG: DUF2730 family protein [Gammaproteobacteria bacterium]|nr:DUF2730 family protein [Gammaproteobacteria bacterium]